MLEIISIELFEAQKNSYKSISRNVSKLTYFEVRSRTFCENMIDFIVKISNILIQENRLYNESLYIKHKY